MKRIFSILISLLMIASVLSGCGLDVPRPEIKKGEFDFSFTYEFKGEFKTISGVYVCEFAGVDWVLDGGYYRDWKGYIKDSVVEETITLGTAADGGVVEIYLNFDPGHFMGDADYEEDDPFMPCASVKVVDDEGMYFENDADRIAQIYGLKILSYEFEDPIENTFR